MKIRLSLVVATTLMMILLLITASTVTSTFTVDDQVVFTNHAHGHTPLTEKLAMIRAETSHAEAERKLGMRMVVTEDDPDAHVEGRVCIINETSHAAGMEDETFCYPRTFKATNVFQAVLYGQHLPKGRRRLQMCRSLP